jgi:hypothetical protein
MKAIIKELSFEDKRKLFATIPESPKPGDWSFNEKKELVQTNQSTCVWFNTTVVGPVNEGVSVVDGEEVEILFLCAKRDKCQYPYCAGSCEGNKGFYIPEKESRGY